jgi:hypothetical protein
MINKLIIVFLGILFQLNILAQTNMPTDTINRYFVRVKQICDKDNGNLWGKPVYGPILVIDSKTRKLIANEPDNENLLKKDGIVYVGTFPENLIISNSTTQFGGKLWTMVSFPFNRSDKDIDLLFTHELFHRLEKVMELKDYFYDNSHMNNFESRIYLKLEWLALLTAVNSQNNNINALSDALLFRTFRRSLYAGADSMENKFEIAEGLAEYTAYSLCFNSDEIVTAITHRKNKVWNSESYVRSFGYYSGLLYGYLLDKYKVDWRKTLKYNDDLGGKLKEALQINLPVNLDNIIKQKRNIYGYDTISTFELSRKQKKDKIVTDYRLRFTANTIFNINLIKPHYGFDPNNLQPLDSLGTIFPFIELVDDWGKLIVTEGGCLVSKDWTVATISSFDFKISNTNEITGKGWSIKLNDDWKVIKNDKKYLIVKKD